MTPIACRAAAIVLCTGCLAALADSPAPHSKRVIGATARLVEDASGLSFVARIDTGAASCSIHAEEVRITDPGESMRENIGKKVSFQTRSASGASRRIETTIASTVRVKTSDEDASERRYKVWLTLRYGDTERRVRVTLNDRSHMQHPLLIGRNFLKGWFVVDVEREFTDGAG